MVIELKVKKEKDGTYSVKDSRERHITSISIEESTGSILNKEGETIYTVEIEELD